MMGGSTELRSDLDFYETPFNDTLAFLNASGWVPPSGVVWEPAAGNCALSVVLHERFPHHTIINTDIKMRDIPLDKEHDFLLDSPPSYVPGHVDIITNPPFSQAYEFVEKALDITDGDIIMLLRLAFLETTRRRELFDKKHLKEVWVSSKRIHFSSPSLKQREKETGKKSNSGMAMAWFVFNRNYEGDPVIKWI